MSDQNEHYEADFQESLNSEVKVDENVENQSHTDTNVISIDTSEDFQNIDPSLSQQVSSTFNTLNESEGKQQHPQQQKQQNNEQNQQEQIQNSHQSEKQQQLSHQNNEQQQKEQQTQQIKPEQLVQETEQLLQEKPQQVQVQQKPAQPEVDYERIVSVKIFQKIINDSLELKNQGNNFFKAHQYKDAIDKYSQGLRLLDPKQFYGATQAECQKMAEVSASLLFNIGSCFFNINSWKKAQIYFTQTITINRDHIKALYKRALCYYELQNYEEAMADIKLAFSKDKSNVEIHKSYEKILEKYNEQAKKDKESLKQISSKIFRTDSQKSIPQQLKSQQILQNQEGQQEQDSMWGIVAPLLLVGGAALFFGYKKWFGK